MRNSPRILKSHITEFPLHEFYLCTKIVITIVHYTECGSSNRQIFLTKQIASTNNLTTDRLWQNSR